MSTEQEKRFVEAALALHDDEPPVMQIDGHDRAILGISSVWMTTGEHITRLVYDGDRIIETLIERDGMSLEDAEEFVAFNIEGAYVGPGTPVIVWAWVPDMDEEGDNG